MAVWSALGGMGLDFGSIIKLPELVLILFYVGLFRVMGIQG